MSDKLPYPPILIDSELAKELADVVADNPGRSIQLDPCHVSTITTEEWKTGKFSKPG